MTHPKQLPENLKDLEQKTAFKSVYKKHTVDELHEALIEAETDYLSDDNKAALVWRYMDAKGMAFDEAATTERKDDQEATSEQNDDQTNGDELLEDPKDETDAPAVKPEADVEPVDPVEDSAVEANKVDKDDKTTPDDAPASDTKQLEDKPTDVPAKTQKADEPKTDYVAIKNNGEFNFLETATSTLVRAGQTTEVYPTVRTTKEQIVRNVEQYNYTRGNKLKITN